VNVPRLELAELTLRETVHRIDDMVSNGGGHYVCFCEANMFTNAMRSAPLRKVLDGADLVLADGISVLLLGRLQRRSVPKRVPGPTVLPEMCDRGRKKGYRHFFYGGGPGVAEKLADNLRERYPGLQVVGTYCPPYSETGTDDEEKVRRIIEEASPDLLWVALGSPKQELWIGRHLPVMNVPVMLGVGAAFDFHAGTRRWAPLWIRKIGMEWAFRMLTGGWRTFRRNVRCVSLMAVALVAAALGRLWRKLSASADRAAVRHGEQAERAEEVIEGEAETRQAN